MNVYLGTEEYYSPGVEAGARLTVPDSTFGETISQGIRSISDITTSIIEAVSAGRRQERALSAQKSQIIPGLDTGLLLPIAAIIGIPTVLYFLHGRKRRNTNV